MIRKAGQELVLYYNPEASSKVMKLKGVLVRMGVRIRNVAPEQVTETVGALAGFPAISVRSRRQRQMRHGTLKKQNRMQVYFLSFRRRCW